MNSRPIVADAAETRLCVWLSVTTLVGLVACAVLGWTRWRDWSSRSSPSTKGVAPGVAS
ncbi:hypothetical protein SK571_23675 [Lentzea sp. BCCO 10_0798]|uniref:Lipoprotein n=1 Tax=Lentzea kristufekii TaxID=3095430 RepID=A0ABU4TX56_9PSEU|nr:hypothetical protein [Lentzea sp. BCCO 10_0798]MDX8052396.1 hypothetical protein [Lentzea sp. BCCO 10_0798]